jgi:hypothetical protein
MMRMINILIVLALLYLVESKVKKNKAIPFANRPVPLVTPRKGQQAAVQNEVTTAQANKIEHHVDTRKLQVDPGAYYAEAFQSPYFYPGSLFTIYKGLDEISLYSSSVAIHAGTLVVGMNGYGKSLLTVTCSLKLDLSIRFVI